MKKVQCSALHISLPRHQFIQRVSHILHHTGYGRHKLFRSVHGGRLLHCFSRLLIILLVLGAPACASAASVILAWDANDPSPDGYRIFVRSPGLDYDYGHPAWQGTATQGNVDQLADGQTYYAVVRAFVGTEESGISNEIEFTTPPADTPPPSANQDPVADAGGDQAVSAGISVVLNGAASSDADGSIVTYQWTQTDGPTVALEAGATVEASFTAPDVTGNTTLAFQLKVTDNQGASAVDTCQVIVVPADSGGGGNDGPPDPGGSTPGDAVADIRVNCGGDQYTDGDGNVWSADTGFNTGNNGSTADAIAGTTDDPLYRTERWDRYSAPEMVYSFTVPDGDYQVNLHFAEIYKGASYVGGRVFNVEIEGALVLENLDIFAEAGADTALIETIPVTVSDGQLDIVFRHGVEDPKVSAIEILGQSTVVEDTEPPSVPGGLTGTAAGPSSINLDWSDSSDTGGSGLGGYLVFRDGAQVGDVTGSSFSDTGLGAGTTYTYTVLAYDNAGNQSAQSESIDVSAPGDTVADIRINCGGDQYTDGDGNVWSADTGFNTGNKGSTKDAIAGTTDDPLYRTERWDRHSAPDLAYSFSVPNGDYQVNLHFAEIYKGASYVGGRVFDVEIEGALVLEDLDIYAEVGADAALIKTIPVTVSDGQLNIVFRHGVEDPKVSAIEILGQGTVVEDTEPPSVPGGLTGTAAGPSSINLDWSDSSDTGGSGLGGYLVFRNGAQVGDVTGSSFSDMGLGAGTTYTYTVLAYDNAGNQSAQSESIDVSTPVGKVADIRVNCGGSQYTDAAGNVWSADTGFNTGRTSSTKDAIAGTSDDPLYRTERWDRYSAPEMAYSFSVPNGDYEVNLHFAEIYKGASYVGGRVFDVEIEGALVLENLDIYAEVGADAALIETIPVTVSDGQLDIVFRHGVEDPKVSAIEIISYASPAF